MKISRTTHHDSRVALCAFTMAEVLVALLVVSIVVVSLYTGVSSGFSLVKLSREDLRATQIMLQRLEALRLYTWSQLTNASYFSTNTFTAFYDPAGQSSGSGGAVYTVSTVVTTNTPSATYGPDMRRITVQVSWPSGQVNRRREMSTYAARYGMQNYVFGLPSAP